MTKPNFVCERCGCEVQWDDEEGLSCHCETELEEEYDFDDFDFEEEMGTA